MITAPVYKVNDILQLLRIGRSTLYRWIRTGTFPAPHQVGGSSTTVFWRSKDVDAWLQHRDPSSTIVHPEVVNTKKRVANPRSTGSRRHAGAVKVSLFN